MSKIEENEIFFQKNEKKFAKCLQVKKKCVTLHSL